MNRRISFWVLGSSFLTLSLAALPAASLKFIMIRPSKWFSLPFLIPSYRTRYFSSSASTSFGDSTRRNTITASPGVVTFNRKK